MNKITNVIKGGLMSLLLLSFSYGEKLYVYYPSTMKSNVVQQKVQGVAGDVTVTVFGKYRDFAMKAAMDKPDAIMAKTMGDLPGYSVGLNAVRNGSKTEKYVLLSVDTPVDISAITSTTVIGVVDYDTRNKMNTFVGSLLGVTSKVKHVTKVEDLLPLLTFKMAQGVIVPEADVEFFRKKSNLNFVTTPLTSSSNVAIVATNGGGTSSLEVAKKVAEVVPGFMGSIEWKN